MLLALAFIISWGCVGGALFRFSLSLSLSLSLVLFYCLSQSGDSRAAETAGLSSTLRPDRGPRRVGGSD